MLLMLLTAGAPNPNEIPPWLRVHGDNPLLKSVLEELFASEAFAGAVGSRFAPEDNMPYRVVVGGRPYLDELQRTGGGASKIKWDPRHGAVSIHNIEPDSSVHLSGVVLDLDRIHRATRRDSTKTREAIRDALIHEFAHLVPLAESRHMRNQTGDPTPGDPQAADHPVIRGENVLRGLLGLPAKTDYGLLGATGRR
jgi:hypothetical protein